MKGRSKFDVKLATFVEVLIEGFVLIGGILVDTLRAECFYEVSRVRFSY